MSVSLLTCALGWDESRILSGIKNPWSKQFRSRSADVTYRSSDGVLFKIHSLYLKAHTEALDPPDGLSRAEVAELPEDSETLDLLFRFVYPIPQPNLSRLRFDALQKLAEAAEKYGVYPAMGRCKTSMEKFLRTQPSAIFLYAFRHDHEEFLDQAAFLLLGKPVEVAIRGMSPECGVIWVRYYAAWDLVRREVLSKLCQQYSIGGCPTSEWPLLTRLNSNLTLIQHFASGTASAPPYISKLSSAFGRANTYPHQNTSIQQLVRRIPPFSGFRSTADARGWGETTLATGETGAIHCEGESAKRYPSPFSDEEIIFRSSDGKRFAIHRAAIKSVGDGFPLPSSNEEVALPESGFTLDLLMRFMHKMAQPDLNDLIYEQLESLAMAAHKYRVHHAMGVCKDHLRKFSSLHGPSVFIYAVRAEDDELMDLVTPSVLDMCFKDVVSQLPDDLVIPWAMYHALWTNAAQKAFNIFLQRPAENIKDYPRRTRCPWCAPGTQHRTLLSRVGEGIAGFRKLRAQGRLKQSGSLPCIECWAWVLPFDWAYTKKIEPFSSFVKRLKHGSSL